MGYICESNTGQHDLDTLFRSFAWVRAGKRKEKGGGRLHHVSLMRKVKYVGSKGGKRKRWLDARAERPRMNKV
jgi:hypothetical protein